MARNDSLNEGANTRPNGLFVAALIMGLIGLVLIFTVVASPVGILLLGLAVVLGLFGFSRKR